MDLHNVYEQVCLEQEESVRIAKAWASVSKELLQNRNFPLGFPGEIFRDELMEYLDLILRAPERADHEAAMGEAHRRLQDNRDSALDARRDFKEPK